MFKVIEKF